MGNYVNASPEGLKNLAETIRSSSNKICSECRTLDSVISEVKSALDTTTYRRVDGMLTQIEPSVKSAAENAKVLYNRILQYAEALEKVQRK